MRLIRTVTGLCVLILTLVVTPASSTKKISRRKPEPIQPSIAALWRQPADLPTRDLYYGLGGKAHAPTGDFKFLEEDKHGGSPKFDVEDRLGNKWRVKLGEESKPETVATRLLWAVGFFTDEDYYLPLIHVDGLPRLHRGQKYVTSDGSVRGARLELKVK